MQKTLFRSILILLFLPMLQAQFGFIEVANLEGYFVSPENVTLNTAGWFSGKYQIDKEKYIKRNFGFSNWAIRLEHQWAFSAYGMSRTSGVTVGKSGYLYQMDYIATRQGADFMGKDVLAELARKTRMVQDTLRASGKSFFFVIAPNKADFYSEYLLDEHERPSDDVLTNYTVLLQEFKDKGIQHLDINAWFLKMKDTSTYPLYPKTGIHYSLYGAALVTQQIIAETERQSGKDLPELYWDEVVWNEKPQGTDNDIEGVLNLVFEISNTKLAYPQVKINANQKYRPKAIAIGDSFYWGLKSTGLSDKVFDAEQFWYYMKEVYPEKKNFIEIKMEEELQKTEVLYIMLTPHNLKRFLPTFIETLYNFYFDKTNKSGYNERIKTVMELIRNNPQWLESVQKKAKEHGLELEKMIYLDARYMVDEEDKKKIIQA